MDSPFPDSTEQLVASALLLLSLSPCSNEITPKYELDRSENLLLSKSFSRSSASSTMSSDDVSSDGAHGRGLCFITSANSRSDREINLKVVRKSRSKTLCISNCHQTERKVAFPSSSLSETTEGSSCLTGGSSSFVSSSDSCKSKMKRKKKPSAQDVKKKTMKKKKPYYVVSSAHLLRRSEAILKVLGYIGFASEVKIRQLLGDSPDTSKALRMLLKKEKVRRSGAGGRTDPFIYQIAAK
ncbi:uncharacterized protein [Rutidosis leptorrhynchoides]|uniref:uncharacterized protein n=1 Tax=Rutidosis leptorrhynchoides TaxID=125765 RepID=UPI003A98D68F